MRLGVEDDATAEKHDAMLAQDLSFSDRKCCGIFGHQKRARVSCSIMLDTG
jgi:hypothetical protein